MMDVESLSSEDLRTIANERLDSHCFKEAIVLFRILLERKPDDADALNCYGVALLGLGRYREALDAFDAALAITEKPISLKTTPASLSGLSMRDIPKTAAGSTTLAYVFDNADIWFNRGIVLSKMGRYAEAIRSYDRALAIDPDDTDIWRNRGDTLVHGGEMKMRWHHMTGSSQSILRIPVSGHPGAFHLVLLAAMKKRSNRLSRRLYSTPLIWMHGLAMG